MNLHKMQFSIKIHKADNTLLIITFVFLPCPTIALNLPPITHMMYIRSSTTLIREHSSIESQSVTRLHYFNLTVVLPDFSSVIVAQSKGISVLLISE